MKNVEALKDRKEVEIHGQTFAVSIIPAFEADAIYDEIVKNEFTIPLPTKLKILAHTAVKTAEGTWIVLENQPIVEAHIVHQQTLRKLIREMEEYNFAFFDDGEAQ